MVLQHSHKDRAQIIRWRQVAAFEQGLRRKAGPITHKLSTRHRASQQECRAAGAMIRAPRSVFGNRSAKFRDHRNHRFRPVSAELFFERAQGGVQSRKAQSELAIGGALDRKSVV